MAALLHTSNGDGIDRYRCDISTGHVSGLLNPLSCRQSRAIRQPTRIQDPFRQLPIDMRADFAEGHEVDVDPLTADEHYTRGGQPLY